MLLDARDGLATLLAAYSLTSRPATGPKKALSSACVRSDQANMRSRHGPIRYAGVELLGDMG